LTGSSATTNLQKLLGAGAKSLGRAPALTAAVATEDYIELSKRNEEYYQRMKCEMAHRTCEPGYSATTVTSILMWCDTDQYSEASSALLAAVEQVGQKISDSANDVERLNRKVIKSNADTNYMIYFYQVVLSQMMVWVSGPR